MLSTENPASFSNRSSPMSMPLSTPFSVGQSAVQMASPSGGMSQMAAQASASSQAPTFSLTPPMGSPLLSSFSTGVNPSIGIPTPFTQAMGSTTLNQPMSSPVSNLSPRMSASPMSLPSMSPSPMASFVQPASAHLSPRSSMSPNLLSNPLGFVQSTVTGGLSAAASLLNPLEQLLSGSRSVPMMQMSPGAASAGLPLMMAPTPEQEQVEMIASLYLSEQGTEDQLLNFFERYSRHRRASKKCALDGRYFYKVLAPYKGLVPAEMYIRINIKGQVSLPENLSGQEFWMGQPVFDLAELAATQSEEKYPRYRLIKLIVDISDDAASNLGSVHSNLIYIDTWKREVVRFEPMLPTEYTEPINTVLTAYFAQPHILPDYAFRMLDDHPQLPITESCPSKGMCAAYVLKKAMMLVTNNDRPLDRDHDQEEKKILVFADAIETEYGILPEEDSERGQHGFSISLGVPGPYVSPYYYGDDWAYGPEYYGYRPHYRFARPWGWGWTHGGHSHRDFDGHRGFGGEGHHGGGGHGGGGRHQHGAMQSGSENGLWEDVGRKLDMGWARAKEKLYEMGDRMKDAWKRDAEELEGRREIHRERMEIAKQEAAMELEDNAEYERELTAARLDAREEGALFGKSKAQKRAEAKAELERKKFALQQQFAQAKWNRNHPQLAQLPIGEQLVFGNRMEGAPPSMYPTGTFTDPQHLRQMARLQREEYERKTGKGWAPIATGGSFAGDKFAAGMVQSRSQYGAGDETGGSEFNWNHGMGQELGCGCDGCHMAPPANEYGYWSRTETGDREWNPVAYGGVDVGGGEATGGASYAQGYGTTGYAGTAKEVKRRGGLMAVRGEGARMAVRTQGERMTDFEGAGEETGCGCGMKSSQMGAEHGRYSRGEFNQWHQQMQAGRETGAVEDAQQQIANSNGFSARAVGHYLADRMKIMTGPDTQQEKIRSYQGVRSAIESAFPDVLLLDEKKGVYRQTEAAVGPSILRFANNPEQLHARFVTIVERLGGANSAKQYIWETLSPTRLRELMAESGIEMPVTSTGQRGWYYALNARPNPDPRDDAGFARYLFDSAFDAYLARGGQMRNQMLPSRYEGTMHSNQNPIVGPGAGHLAGKGYLTAEQEKEKRIKEWKMLPKWQREGTEPGSEVGNGISKEVRGAEGQQWYRPSTWQRSSQDAVLGAGIGGIAGYMLGGGPGALAGAGLGGLGGYAVGGGLGGRSQLGPGEWWQHRHHHENHDRWDNDRRGDFDWDRGRREHGTEVVVEEETPAVVVQRRQPKKIVVQRKEPTEIVVTTQETGPGSTLTGGLLGGVTGFFLGGPFGAVAGAGIGAGAGYYAGQERVPGGGTLAGAGIGAGTGAVAAGPVGALAGGAIGAAAGASGETGPRMEGSPRGSALTGAVIGGGAAYLLGGGLTGVILGAGLGGGTGYLLGRHGYGHHYHPYRQRYWS